MLDSIYARAKATALQNLREDFVSKPPARLPPGFAVFAVPSGQVIDAIDKAFQGAIVEVQAMRPVPLWQRLRVTWIGSQCPPSVGITALQALLLAGSFWFVFTQWK